MRSGRLYSWHPNGYGMIAASLTEKFYLHCTNIVDAPSGLIDPPVGATVYFDVAPARGTGKFPQAINARIVIQGASL